MSFAIPRNVPDFGAKQRQLEDQLWSSSRQSQHAGTKYHGHSLAGIGSSFAFGNPSRELPMYKDKPYDYADSGRKKSRRFIVYLIIVLALLWWFVLRKMISTDVPNPMVRFAPGHRAPSTGDTAEFWAQRRDHVVNAMERSWAGYEKYAWGYDEYHPNSKDGRQMVPPTGLGWIIVDALDTLMLMNLTKQLTHAREWISNTLSYELDHDVNTFETTIRMTAGFLAAHYLQTAFPDMCPVDLAQGGEALFLEKAVDIADRVLGAFESPSGIPYASVNLKTGQGITSHADGGASSLAEATTLQLEYKYLANLTSEQKYWDKVEKVMNVVDAAGPHRDALKPIYIHPQSGLFTSNNIRLGSRGDSYYEYLIKQYLQTGEDIYRDMWVDALEGIKKHLITYSSPSNFTILAERPFGLDGDLVPKMDHLVCFMPGTIALSVTDGLTVSEYKRRNGWTPQKQADLDLAVELMKTCWGMYKATKTGLAAEITYFNLPDQRVMYPDTTHRPVPPRMDIFEKDDSPLATWHTDFIIKPADTHNLQRPETIESLFYMYRITEDDMYRRWGSDMLDSFLQHTEAPDRAGYTSIDDIDIVPPPTRDSMESFWLAETLKYFYLLFSPSTLLPLDKVVFNTEAHALPKFSPGPSFKTGWSRAKDVPTHNMLMHDVAGHDQSAMSAIPSKQADAQNAHVATPPPGQVDGRDQAVPLSMSVRIADHHQR